MRSPLARQRAYTVNLRISAGDNQTGPTGLSGKYHMRTHTHGGNTTMADATMSPDDAANKRSRSHASHHNRDFALQKYLLLHEQHESLRNHLEQLLLPPYTSPANGFADSYCGVSVPATSYPAIATAPTSPSISPTRTAFSGQSSPYNSRSSSTSRSHRRRQSLPAGSAGTSAGVGMSGAYGLEPVPDETTLMEVASEEARLLDVNEGIKRALTELLNCEAVRADRAFRTWVQCRLMDTEKELRVGRRRKSAAGVE